jgi:hypothetical protein
MSAFIVEDKTINRVITYIKQECYRDPFFHRRFLEGNGYCGSWDELAQAMYDLNKEAVDYRYKEENVQRKVRYSELYGSLYQALKSLDCFLYQCAEGKVPEKPLYKRLEFVQRHLLRQIVSSSQAYDEAEWD